LQSSQPPPITEVVTLVKVEGTIDELKLLFINPASGKFEPSKGKKAPSQTRKAGKAVVKKTVKRAPSAYNKHMKKELARLKKKHPKTPHATLFKRAAKSWKGSKKKGGKK